MTATDAGSILILLLPFLLSLAGQGSMAKMLCLLSSVIALLLSVREYGAVLPWLMGMIVSGVAVWERIRLRRMA